MLVNPQMYMWSIDFHLFVTAIDSYVHVADVNVSGNYSLPQWLTSSKSQTLELESKYNKFSFSPCRPRKLRARVLREINGQQTMKRRGLGKELQIFSNKKPVRSCNQRVRASRSRTEGRQVANRIQEKVLNPIWEYCWTIKNG